MEAFPSRETKAPLSIVAIEFAEHPGSTRSDPPRCRSIARSGIFPDKTEAIFPHTGKPVVSGLATSMAGR